MAGKRVKAIDKIIGRNVRIHRLAKRMSQTTLGEQLGITFQQIQKYEAGTNRIGSGRLFQISSILSVPIITFFRGTERTVEFDDPILLDLLAEPHAVRLIQAFSNIQDHEIRLSLVKLAEGIATK